MRFFDFEESCDGVCSWDGCVDARRHVNKMCMAAQVPLVESGTAGYLGQVQPLLKVRLGLCVLTCVLTIIIELSRTARNVSIVFPSQLRQRSPFARFARRLRSLSTA